MSQTHYPSLLLVASNHEAKWFKVEENKVTFLAEHFDDKAHFSDKDKGTRRGGRNSSLGGATDVFNTEKAEEVKHHLTNAAVETATLWRAGQYAHLMVAAPEQLKNLTHDKLWAALPKTPYKYIAGNHTKDPLTTLLRLAKESLKVV